MNELPLRDIHLPAAVSAWPPALGWWILALLVIAIIFAIVLFIKFNKNHTPKPKYKKIALQSFGELQTQYKNQQDSIECLRAVSALLRRIALSYLPRETVASLTGEQWIKQLNTLSSENIFNEDTSKLLATAAYREQAKYDSNELLKHCEQWIKGLPDKPNTEVTAQ